MLTRCNALEEDKRETYYFAIAETSPELRACAAQRRQDGKPKLTIDEMTDFILQLDAETTSSAGAVAKAKQARYKSHKGDRSNQRDIRQNKNNDDA